MSLITNSEPLEAVTEYKTTYKTKMNKVIIFLKNNQNNMKLSGSDMFCKSKSTFWLC